MDAVTLRILYLMLTILIFFIISCIMKGSLKIIQKSTLLIFPQLYIEAV